MSYVWYTELKRPERSDDEFSTSWRILKAGGDEDYTNTDCVWFINGSQYSSHYGQGGSMTSDSLQILERTEWYPASTRMLSSVYARVRGTTDEGVWGPWTTSPTLGLLPPYDPELSLDIDTSGSVDEVEVKVSLESESSERECYDTNIVVTRRANFGTQDSTLLNRTTTEKSGSALEWAENVSTIESGLNSADKWIEVVATAKCRGFAGDSNEVSKSHVFAWPGVPQITRISVSGTVTDAGTVIIACKSNQSYYHPVDTVQLQRLKSTTAETPAAAAIAEGWSDVSGSVDDGDCTGLVDVLSSAYPDQGKYTWYRLKAVHGNYTQYSAPSQLPVFEPSPVPGSATVYAAGSCDDGKSAYVDVGWDDDDSTSTEISWADSPIAWESTSGTTEFEFDWKDGSSRSQSYDNTARVYIRSLEEGTTYYVRARRVMDLDGTKFYGDWSSPVAVKPVSAPAWVELQAPGFIARGESLPLTWTFGSEATQTAWRILDSNGKVWASGEDANGATTIPADKLASKTSLTLRVSMTTGGDWKDSAAKTVTIVDRPTCDVSIDATVDAQPVEIGLAANSQNLTAVIAVHAVGVSYRRPDGSKMQYAGDVVHASKVSPAWSSATSGYEATVGLPDMDLVNGASYIVRATVTDPVTGLSSVVSEGTFDVEWDHLAPSPECTVTASSSDLSATLALSEPEEAAEGDVCDVYRLTPDGARLIASGVAFGNEVTDRFAPFSRNGEAAYRVACRTADGDVLWSDFDYTLRGGGIRLDWDGKSVSLPYNVTAEDSIAKSFEGRTHMDGETEGFWDPGATRKASLSTDLIRVQSAEDAELLRDMARYPGAVFVRVANGCAFDADVQLSKVAESYSSGAIAVSLDASEVALTSEHMCGPGDVVEPEEETSGTEGA